MGSTPEAGTRPPGDMGSEQSEIPGAGRLAWSLASAGSGLVLAGGILVLLGWVTGSAALTSLAPVIGSMKANAALCFFLLGAATLSMRRRGHRRTIVRRILSAAVILVATLTLAEYAFEADLGIDELLATDVGAFGTPYPGRMAHTTAICFVLLGIALATRSNVRRARIRQSDLLVVAAALIAFIALTGYLYGASVLIGLGTFTQMALSTSVAFIVLCASMIAITPRGSIGAVLMSTSPGGVVARRLVPAAFVVPIIVGWLRLAGQHAGLYDTEFGVSLVVVTHSVTFTTIAAWVTWTLDREYGQRLSAEQSASTDVLTGLANRRAVTQRLTRLVELAGRGGGTFSLIAIDANHLKQVNDHYGHAAGDAALVRMGDVLVKALRVGDIAGRLGGDEFVAILPATSTLEAGKLAQRLRAAFGHDGRTGGLDAGVGVASWTTGWDADGIIEAADRALYEEKRARVAAV